MIFQVSEVESQHFGPGLSDFPMMNFADWGLNGPATASTTAPTTSGVMDEVMRNGNVPVAGRMGKGFGLV